MSEQIGYFYINKKPPLLHMVLYIVNKINGV
jgi:hypothetical protein